MKPITRACAVLAMVLFCFYANDDFIRGPYAGPAWFAPLDFIMTQIMVFTVAQLLWDGVRFREGEPLISIKVIHGDA